MSKINELVDTRLKNDFEFSPGVWKQDNITDVKIQSMSHSYSQVN